MRHVLIAAALTVVAFASGAVRAQPKGSRTQKAAPVQADDSSDDNNDTSDDTNESPRVEGSVDVMPSENSNGSRTNGSASTHTVERGDTLWDLSQRYMGSPWYWPKVWSYNPEIANPHWIYPGNLVRFFASGEEVPTQVEVGEPLEASTPFDDSDKVQVAGKIGYQPKDGVHMRTKGFVTPKEIEEAGRIVGSFEESEMLSFPQQAYVQFKHKGGAKLGDKYLVFRMQKEVVHPKTDDRVGYLTLIVGTAKAVASNNDMTTVQITASFDEIRRGDLIGPYGETLTKVVSPRAADKDLKGTIISTVLPWEVITAQGSVVVLDLGSDQGVKPGNMFQIVRQQEGLTYENLNYPPHYDNRWPVENVGTCMAFDVKSSASTCVLTRSLREIAAGDTVVLSTGGNAAPRAAR